MTDDLQNDLPLGVYSADASGERRLVHQYQDGDYDLEDIYHYFRLGELESRDPSETTIIWVLEQVLGEHVPPPPPDIPELEEQDPKSVEGLTLRQRTELHQTDPTCANCHKVLDPIGFGLENFDAIGRWRDYDDAGGAIDAAGELPGGEAFATPKELKHVIAKREADLARNLTERLMGYALCRQLEGYDEIVVDQLMEKIAKDNYRMQTLITEIVTSYLFTQRRIKD